MLPPPVLPLSPSILVPATSTWLGRLTAPCLRGPAPLSVVATRPPGLHRLLQEAQRVRELASEVIANTDLPIHPSIGVELPHVGIAATARVGPSVRRVGPELRVVTLVPVEGRRMDQEQPWQQLGGTLPMAGCSLREYLNRVIARLGS